MIFMGVKRVRYFGQNIINLAGATVDATTLVKGVKAWNSAGDLITGTLEISDSGGSGGSGSTPDYACLYKEVRVTSAMTSGTTTWVTQAELLAAGIISATSQEMTTQWNHYSVEVSAIGDKITHRTKQLVWLYASDSGAPASSSSTLRRWIEYHNTSTTTLTISTNTNPITTNTTGHLYSSASYGIRTTSNSNYGLGIATYAVKIACWGRK